MRDEKPSDHGRLASRPRSVRREGDAWLPTADLSGIVAPSSIAALLAARLDRLPGTERIVTECASVIGKVVSRATIDVLGNAQGGCPGFPLTADSAVTVTAKDGRATITFRYFGGDMTGPIGLDGSFNVQNAPGGESSTGAIKGTNISGTFIQSGPCTEKYDYAGVL